ncbi:hypothetical protein AURDEDRAFT_185803 [Auricularia subglabra TFB-10046 SS5]|nr:hypothetical protein AURDEDRAFT_185803 [Auricularia subglabra TFB-10046 SS5]
MSPDKVSLVNAAGDTNSAGLSDLNASFLADVPAIAIGILGFAVAKLLFVFNGMTRPSILILLSVLSAFLGVTFDSFRIFQTSSDPTDTTTRTLLVLRELFIAVSIFIRYLFFLEYASRSPDSTGANNRRWWEWPIIRVIFEGLLLLTAIVMLVLQLIWRFVDRPTVYTADVVLEICWTTVLMIKMGYSIIAFPDPANRWSFAKMLLPIMAALLIEWGISVGNAVMRDFADCSAGRFLQAVEVYIILLALTSLTFSRLISNGPPTSLSRGNSLTGSSEKAGGRVVISKPSIPVGLPKFSFTARPRKAPRPPAPDQGPSRGPMQGLSNWLATRLSGEGPRNVDLEKQQQPTRPPGGYTLTEPTPIGTPEIVQWRRKPEENGSDSGNSNDRPSSAQALALLAPRVVDLGYDVRASRVGIMPPPTPPPQGPLPLPPIPSANFQPAVANRDSDRDSGVDVDMDSEREQTTGTDNGKRPVSSTFGHVTSTETPPSTRDNTTDPAVIAAIRANRRSSAPVITVTGASDTQSLRATRPLSNPPGALMTQSIEALLREQEELDAAYPMPSPDPRRSVMSLISAETGGATEEGGVGSNANTNANASRVSVARTSEEINSSSNSNLARESTKSDFSLSKFPAPPSMKGLRGAAPSPPQTLSSRFSAESADSAMPRRRPPTLTVQTDMRRLTLGLKSGSRPNSSATQWDVTSFIGEMSVPSEVSTPPAVPPPSAEPDAPGPMSTVSLAPSPILPRPPPRIRRKRNADSFATLAESTMSGQDDYDVTEPVRTQNATRATRVSRVRFVQQPPSGALFFDPGEPPAPVGLPRQPGPQKPRLSISSPMRLGTGGVGRGSPAPPPSLRPPNRPLPGLPRAQ